MWRENVGRNVFIFFFSVLIIFDLNACDERENIIQGDILGSKFIRV